MPKLEFSQKHLIKKKEELEKDYNDLTDLINSFKTSLKFDDLSAKQKFNLKKNIEQEEEKREEIVRKIEEIENLLTEDSQTVSYQDLHDALLELGYLDQDKAFYNIYQALNQGNHSVAAFLIHGPSDEYGQLWLFNRLLKKRIGTKKTRTNSKIIQIELSSLSQGNNPQRILREISRRYSDIKNNSSSVQQLAQYLCQLWQSQNVFLVFTGVTESILTVLLEDIWTPIVNQAMALNPSPSREQVPDPNHYKLFMFLVDYGLVKPKPNLFLERFCDNFTAIFPFLTPKITEFEETILQEWCFIKSHIFPDEMTNFEELVQEIIDKSEGGIPELVFEEICDRCNVCWEDIKTGR